MAAAVDRLHRAAVDHQLADRLAQLEFFLVMLTATSQWIVAVCSPKNPHDSVHKDI